MRKFLSLSTVAVLAFAGGLPAASADTASAALTPAHSIALTHGNSPFRGFAGVIASSPDYLVYSLQQGWQRGTYGPVAIRVRAQDGTTTPLTPPAGVDPRFVSWSLVGSMLTASNQDANSGKVYWWNLSAGTSGSGSMPNAGFDQYEGSAPDGWIFETQSDGKLYRQSAAGGSPTLIGAPFASSDVTTFSVFVDDDGVAVGSDSGSAVSYVPWGSTTFQPLDIGAGAYNDVYCYSLAYQAVACGADDAQHNYVLRVPTDGGAPVVTTLSNTTYVGRVALSASLTAFSVYQNSSERLYSVPGAAGTPLTKSTYLVGFELAGAYGSFVVGSVTNSSLGSTPDAAHSPTVLVQGPKTGVHAAGVVLTTNRVVYTDDQKHYNAGDVWSRSLSGKSRVTAGKASLVIPSAATSYGLSAAGKTTVSDYPGSFVVAASHHRTTVKNATSAVTSGRYVGYLTYTGALYRYDTKTHKKAKLTTKVTAFAISGSTLVFMKHDGSVWKRGLVKKGKLVRLAAAPKGQVFDGFVWASGNWAAWTLSANKQVTAFRNFKTMKKAVAVPSKYTLVGLGTNGVLLRTTRFKTNVAAAWYLRKFAAAGYHQVLSQTYTFDEWDSSFEPPGIYRFQVAVNGGRIAWITPLGVLRVAPLPKKLR